LPAAAAAAAAAGSLFRQDHVEAAATALIPEGYGSEVLHTDMLHQNNITTADVATAGDVSLGSWLHLLQAGTQPAGL
jgi:hypothetical protein